MKRVHLLLFFLLVIFCVSFAFSSAEPTNALPGPPGARPGFTFTAASSPAQTPSTPIPSPSPVATATIPVPTPWPGAIIEDPVSQLRILLTPVGIAVAEPKLIDVNRVRSYHTVVIEWRSYRDAPELVDYNSTNFERINELTLIDNIARQGTMQAYGIAAMTNDQILVAGVNAQSELVWWTRIRDPRVVRAESADSEGHMQGKIYHRSRVEIHIDVPDNPDIKNLKLYVPQPVGGQVTLVQLYALPLNLNQAQ